MSASDWLTERFEETRPHPRGVARRRVRGADRTADRTARRAPMRLLPPIRLPIVSRLLFVALLVCPPVACADSILKAYLWRGMVLAGTVKGDLRAFRAGDGMA